MAKKLNKQINQEFPYKMLKEIFAQPEVIRNIIKEYFDGKKDKLKIKALSGKAGRIKKIKRIILLGRGSSFYAAMYGRRALGELAGVPSAVEIASEFNNRHEPINNKTLIIALSQSGQTADIIKAVRRAKKEGAFIISITNAEQAKLPKLADAALYNLAGEERALAATKTFTSQLIILTLLAAYIGEQHKMSKATGKRLLKAIRLLPIKIEKILKLHANLQIIANKYYKTENLYILGRGNLYPIALESALKLKETTYIHSEGMAAGELKHGPIAVLDKKFLCIFLAPVDNYYGENARLIKEVKALKKKIIAITTMGNRKLFKYSDRVIYVPKTIDLLTPILSVIPLQLLAYYIAVFKGINVDRPRYLTKFVG